MKRSILAVIAGATLAAAATLPVTLGQPRPSAGVQGQWTYPYPRPAHMNRVQVLAHQVADAADRVEREATTQSRRFTWREQRALAELRVLDDSARRFHAQVERSLQNPARTDDDFRTLIGAYHRASYSIRNLPPFSFVRRDFMRLGNLVEQLMSYYDGHRYLDQRGPDRDRNRPDDRNPSHDDRSDPFDQQGRDQDRR